MDAYEATSLVFSRVQTMDPDNASKIMGLLLIQDPGEKEMIRLAFGPETLLQSVVFAARAKLGISLNKSSASPFLSRQSSLSSPRIPNLPPPLAIPKPSFPFAEDLISKTNGVFSPYANGDIYGGDTWNVSPHRRSCSLSEIPYVDTDLSAGFGWKPCLYFARGYCKNGTSCRFLHGADSDKIGSPVMETQSCDCVHQQQRFVAAATALANPFPYFSKHDSPRGLMMAEDLVKFGRSRLDCAVGMATPSSRQIYLTFPADSTFREEDVSNYFSIYGPVQDVRIPYQQKRMFGFVTFIFPDTVKFILAKGNPHFVCDSRVLVKPYKEKGKVLDKKQQVERVEFSTTCATPANGFYSNHDLLWRKKLEEQEAIEFQERRLMGLKLLDFKTPFGTPKSPIDRSPNHCRFDAENRFIPAHFGADTESIPREETDLPESFEINLPDSPFAPPNAPSAINESTSEFSDINIAVSSSISATNNDPNIASSLLMASSAALDMASLKSCYFPLSRLPLSQETIEM